MVIHVTNVSRAQLGNKQYAVWCHFCVWRIKHHRNLSVGGVQSMSWKQVWIWCNGSDNGMTDIHQRQWPWCPGTTTTEDSVCHSDAHTRQGRHICCMVYRAQLITRGITEKWVPKNATDYHKAHCMGLSYIQQVLLLKKTGFAVHRYRGWNPNHHVTFETAIK
jgi:hypothetical protein